MAMEAYPTNTMFGHVSWFIMKLLFESRCMYITIRDRPARALPGPPLALSGVGYDLHDLAIYKFMPKAEHIAVMAKKDQKQAER